MPVKKNPPPDRQRLMDALEYSKETGLFVNRVSRMKARVGAVAGHKHHSGIMICLDGTEYLAHRLAWFYVTGGWPEEIDHRDLDPANNRWSNLRECSHRQNLFNRRIAKHNRCGFKGVQAHQGRWRARVARDGRLVRSGMFDSPEAAHAAYCGWVKEIHGEFARAS